MLIGIDVSQGSQAFSCERRRGYSPCRGGVTTIIDSLSTCVPSNFTRSALEELYERTNRRELIHPDPLEFVHHYTDPRDQEVAGLVASSLAYGRVKQILRSVATILQTMGSSPAAFVRSGSEPLFRQAFVGFKHRFTTGDEIAALLAGMQRIYRRHGSLEACFVRGLHERDDTVQPALAQFVAELAMPPRGGMFLPEPGKGSACKRLNLFLRWMVRCDDVDPGPWESVPAAKLIVPLDTHMHRIGTRLGLTCRRQADLATALELTRLFRSIAPEDPVRYDFALTRLGIRPAGWTD